MTVDTRLWCMDCARSHHGDVRQSYLRRALPLPQWAIAERYPCWYRLPGGQYTTTLRSDLMAIGATLNLHTKEWGLAS